MTSEEITEESEGSGDGAIGWNDGAVHGTGPIGEADEGVRENEAAVSAHKEDETVERLSTSTAEHPHAARYTAFPLTSDFHILPDNYVRGGDSGYGGSGMTCHNASGGTNHGHALTASRGGVAVT